MDEIIQMSKDRMTLKYGDGTIVQYNARHMREYESLAEIRDELGSDIFLFETLQRMHELQKEFKDTWTQANKEKLNKLRKKGTVSWT